MASAMGFKNGLDPDSRPEGAINLAVYALPNLRTSSFYG